MRSIPCRRILAAALTPTLALSSLTLSAGAVSTDGQTLTFSDSAISSSGSGSGYEIDGTDLKITESGTYTLTGSCADGSVTVKKNVTDVTLILDDLTLSSSDTAPITCNKSSGVTIQTSGTTTLTDKESTENESSDTYEGAAIKVKSDASLTVTGSGTLNVNGSCKNGIKGASNASVTVKSSTLNIDASHDALSSDGSVTVTGGALSLKADNDGISAQPEDTDTASAGTVTVSGGSVTITSGGDGIQSTGKLSVSNGTLKITAGGGYTEELADDVSAKGLKSDTAVSLTGGIYTLNCADDAIHTDGDAVLSAGTYTISSGDDGVHADGALTVGTKSADNDDLKLTIQQSYEGLEGTTVTLYSGTGSITSSDDGINAANSQNPTADFAINCYGGTWSVTAGGDGLDSNKDVNLYGGTIEVYSYGNGDAALDYDGACNYKGGTLLAVGMSGMAQAPSSGLSLCFGTSGTFSMGGGHGGQRPDDSNFDPTQKPGSSNNTTDSTTSGTTSGSASSTTPPEKPSGDSNGEPPTPPDGSIPSGGPNGGQPGGLPDDGSSLSISQGSKLEIRNSSGKTIYSATSLTRASSVVFSSEDLTEGETYTLYIDGSEAGTATATADVGTAGSGNANGGQPGGGRFPENGTSSSDANTNQTAKLPFSDVNVNNWYYNAVQYVYNKGLMQGTGSSTFSPATSTTRGMVVTLLYRLAGSPSVSGSNSFSDVDSDAYYAAAVTWAAKNNIVSGYDSGKFGPNDPITREQLAAILYRYASAQSYDVSKTGDLSSFSDVSKVSSYAKTALAWANGSGLITGTNNQTLNADGTADRSQLAAILMRFCESYTK